jgi:hypothetical protein
MRKLCALFLLLALNGHADEALRVVSAGPVGETATLAEANEIRVVFSEPMVVVGRIPQPVTAPFFSIEPAVPGTFRWSGTTTLIFTPNPPLPFATSYTVSIAKSARSIDGSTLDQPYRWSFTTPTIRLQAVDWYRKPAGPLVIRLRFNQPVDAETLLPHIQLRTTSHLIDLPRLPADGIERLKKTEPAALEQFEKKRAAALAAAASEGRPVFASIAADWDKERFPPATDQLILETAPGLSPDTAIEILIDGYVARSPRHARS